MDEEIQYYIDSGNAIPKSDIGIIPGDDRYSDPLFFHIHTHGGQKLPLSIRHSGIKITAPSHKTGISCSLSEKYHIQALERRYGSVICDNQLRPIGHIKGGGQITFTPWCNSVSLFASRVELVLTGIYNPIDTFIHHQLLPHDILDAHGDSNRIPEVRNQTEWKSCIILESGPGTLGNFGYNKLHLQPLRMMHFRTNQDKKTYYSLVLKSRKEFQEKLNATEFYTVRRGKLEPINKPLCT